MADKLSLKWLDGNSDASGETAPENPTFNVDNPTMWTPLSVLSGLASGFCERRAVINSMFATDGATEKDWYATGDLGSANRDDITRNCMHNLALGSTGDANLYQSAVDASLQVIGNAGTANYMTAMDAAITSIITGDGSRYVTADNQDYSFTNLAAAAVATAAATGIAESAIQIPQSDGGSFNTQNAMALPVEWAKERKWMLDELKWAVTLGGGTSYNADTAANYTYLDDGIFNYGTTAQAAYEITLADAEYQWEVATDYPDVYRGLTISNALIEDEDYLNCDVRGLPFKLFMELDTEEIDGQEQVVWSMTANNDDRESYLLGVGNNMYLETPEPIKGAVTAKVYFDSLPLPYYPIPVTQEGETTYLISTVSEATVAAANVTLYKVVDGGILNVPSGREVNNVIVEGGTVNIANGGYIKYCTVLPEGHIDGIKNVDYLSIDGMRLRDHNYSSSALGAGYQYTIIEGSQNDHVTSTIATGDPEIAAPSSYYIKSGGTLVFSASYNYLDYLQTNDQNNARIFVDSGGCLLVKGSPKLPRIDIYPYKGAPEYVTFGRHRPHDITTGTTTHYCWHRAYTNTDSTGIPDELYTTSIPADDLDWDISDVILYENTGSITDPTFVATSYIISADEDTDIAYVYYDDDCTARLRCPVVVFSGGTCIFGLYTRFGQDSTDYYGNSLFFAYPGATVQFVRNYHNVYNQKVNGGAGGFEASVHAAVADTTNITLYRMLDVTPSGDISWKEAGGMGRYDNPVDYSLLTYTDDSHLTNKPTIYDVTGATFYNYYAQDLPFAVTGGTPVIYTGDPMGTHVFSAVSCMLFSPLDFTVNGTPITKGWNEITVSSTSLYGLKCVLTPGDSESVDYDSALFYIKRTGNEWIRRDLAVQIPNPTTASIIKLIAMSSTAPETYALGDMYYNTTSKKIFTAVEVTVNDTTGIQWSTEGSDPVANGIYFNYSNGNTYQWTGTGSAATMTELPVDGWNYSQEYYPGLIYTPLAGYTKGTPLYKDPTCSIETGSELYSLSYPLITGSTVNIPNSPTYGSFLGVATSYAIYLCSIVDLEVTTAGTGAPVNHYQDFYVRQFQTSPAAITTN